MSEAAGIPPYSEDQAESARLVRESAAGFLDVGRARALRFTMPGFSREAWREMAQLGWIGLLVPESAGGAGLSMIEMCALAEELGRGLAPEPLIPCAISALLLAEAGEREVLGQLLAGEAVVLTAWQDRPNTLEVCTDLDRPRCSVPMAGGATHLLLPGPDGLHLLKAADCTITTETTVDGGHIGTVRAQPGRPIGQAALGPALDRAALATAAYLLGGMEAAFAMTLSYLRTRQQFGRPIGSFQALQHKAVDTRLQIALTRAVVEEAAARPEPALCSRAKARASEAAMLVQQNCLQMSGGIGYTDQYDLGLYLRKAMVLAPAFGGPALHRARFMALSPELEEV
ncbi:MAG: acyl-CoA/acyl-ACP dehydrogenase [Rhodovarius sp.]|nr:acyl-CoA/acyl-ACP dehydrogenase [Rhodovarius sp.]